MVAGRLASLDTLRTESPSAAPLDEATPRLPGALREVAIAVCSPMLVVSLFPVRAVRTLRVGGALRCHPLRKFDASLHLESRAHR